jgi:hypothetical protein
MPQQTDVSFTGIGLRTRLLAIHTPTIAVTDTMRETIEIATTSVISPEVGANAVSFALAPGYQLNEGERRFRVYVALVLRQ